MPALDPTITAAAIATIISSMVATIVALLINSHNRIKDLRDQLDKIIHVSIQYPYLEDPNFTSTWDSRPSGDEKYIRYENYCCLVFNFMERLADFYGHDDKKINEFVNLKSWIRLHRKCWEQPSIAYDNVEGYNQPFRELAKGYLQ